LLRALEKRPISMDQVDETLERIEQHLRTRGERAVKSNSIGEEMMDGLKSLDAVAYIRFASVYRRFKNIHEFKKEIDSLKLNTEESNDNEKLNDT